ncbi:hypothetical protein SRABI76_02864 [Microbacterium oxydans]|uniref:DUF6049 family protein n=1 Tax=Microbacterium oxydans TaxID=82380 RepID=UPI001D69D187|nr:DUF6049 family protein [Microbacterium oxydans]CAH0235400.1 hypothetical protein SRABI76_02864 [Microbacterium oxydans]
MTATTPDDTGFRPRLRRLVRKTVVFAIALGVSGMLAPTGAFAATEPPNDNEGNVELYVSAGARGNVTLGAATSAVVTVQNETDAEVSPGRVLVELNRTPLADDAAITSWLDGDEVEGTFAALGTESTESVDARASGTTTISVPPELLADLAPGVYPLRAGLSGATTGAVGSDDVVSRNVSATSVLVVSAGESAQVAVVVPITATPANGTLLTSEELASLTAEDGALTAQLDGVTGTAAILGIDPAIVAAIRVLGTSAPSEAKDWLERLDELPNERFALQFGDADATAQAQAQLPALLQPTTLSTFLTPSNFPSTPATPTPGTEPADSPSPTPTPSPTSGPALPDDEALSEIAGATPGVLWPRGGASQADLAMFAGYFEGAATTILPSSDTAGAASAHALAGDAEVLVSDDEAAGALSLAAGESDSSARQRHLAAASAHLFLAAQRAPGAPLLVGLERDETRTASALRDAISTADTPGFSLSALRGLPTAPVTVTGAADPAYAAAVGTLLGDEQTLGQFATILSDPQLLLSLERIRIMRTLAVGVPTDSFAKAVAQHQRNTQETLGAVSIPPSSTIQLLTAAADLPFGVRNDLPWPVTIQLSVAPTDPRLEVKPVVEQTVQANTSMRIKVPVEARVGSGEVGLRLKLSSPTGVPIGGTEVVRVAVRAEWEGIGIGVFGGMIVLLIALGVVRTVRRRRREAIESQSALAEEEEAVLSRPFPPESKDGRE